MISEKNTTLATAEPSADAPARPLRPTRDRQVTGSVAEDSQNLSLEAVMGQIRADARQDPLFYLVRSNTSYDGE